MSLLSPRRRRVASCLALAAAGALLAACVQPGPAAPPPPVAPASAPAPLVLEGARAYPLAVARRVTHTYHGVAVDGDFEWLEDMDNLATRMWIAAENAYSRNYLDAMPARAALKQRLQALISSTTNGYADLVEAGGTVFALKSAPPKQQPLLVALASVDDPNSERVVFDPNEEAPDGSLAIGFFRPSPDGKRVAISVASGGEEGGTLRIVELAGGRALPDVLPRVASPTGGGDVAWGAGGTGLYYTRYPAPGERDPADAHLFEQVFFHRLGTPVADDALALGAEFPRLAQTRLAASRDGRIVTALVASGDGEGRALYLKTADARGDGAWRRIAAEADGVKDVRIGDDSALYLLSRADAPRGKLLRLPVSASTATIDWAKVPVVVPQSDGAIELYELAGRTLVVADLVGGPSRLRQFELGSRRATTVALPPVAGVRALARVGKRDVVAQVTSYLNPAAWSHVLGKAPRRTALVEVSDANFNDSELVREFATAKDGTKIPLNILRRRGTPLDGHNPTILLGAGAFSLSQKPAFAAPRRVWLDRGGVYAIANVRGGGEFGDAWHRAGSRAAKQTTIDDFIAAADYLVKQGYTEPARLGIRGGPGAGPLMGAALTQRPALFGAVVSTAGLHDMLRAELDPTGAFDANEFGSVQDAAQFAALHAYSPLHRVRDGVDYPAVLAMSRAGDGRVDPAHSRKMIARLQRADPGGLPILLRTGASGGAGPGIALSERVEETTDDYAFFVNELTGGVQ